MRISDWSSDVCSSDLTGHTAEAGYGFTGSAEQNGRRLIMVLAGLNSYNGRIGESVRFMDWGFKAWKAQPLFKKGQVVDKVPVQLGSDRDIALVAPKSLAVTLPRTARDRKRTRLNSRH